VSGSGSAASGQVRSSSRSIPVVPVEGVESGPAGDPASQVQAAASNR
jgi:hypothetical protein